jgi:hypothetical protein
MPVRFYWKPDLVSTAWRYLTSAFASRFLIRSFYAIGDPTKEPTLTHPLVRRVYEDVYITAWRLRSISSTGLCRACSAGHPQARFLPPRRHLACSTACDKRSRRRRSASVEAKSPRGVRDCGGAALRFPFCDVFHGDGTPASQTCTLNPEGCDSAFR